MFLGDDSTKVFINAVGTADDVSQEMKAFLDYLQGKGIKNDFTRQIDEEVIKARAHEEWRVEHMSKVFVKNCYRINSGEVEM